MGTLRNTNTIIDGDTIADASVVNPQIRIRDFTNGQVGAENFRADAGIASFRLAQPVSRVVFAGSIHSLADATRRTLLHLSAPAYFKGRPSEIKLTGIHAYVGENVGGTATFTIDARCFNVRENRWTGPDGTTVAAWSATGQTLFTNPLSLTWNTYNAVLPRVSSEDYSILQLSVVMTAGTVRGLAVYVFAEAARLPT